MSMLTNFVLVNNTQKKKKSKTLLELQGTSGFKKYYKSLYHCVKSTHLRLSKSVIDCYILLEKKRKCESVLSSNDERWLLEFNNKSP